MGMPIDVYRDRVKLSYVCSIINGPNFPLANFAICILQVHIALVIISDMDFIVPHSDGGITSDAGIGRLWSERRPLSNRRRTAAYDGAI